LMAQREPTYAEADFVLDSIDGPHATAVDQALAELKARGLAEDEATT